jgi:DNA-binding transcriptional ArsR family regulator
MTEETVTNFDIPDMKSIEIVDSVERSRILLDETRSKIIRVMRQGIFRDGEMSFEFSVGEVSERLGISPQRIYHHVDKLETHEFLHKSKEVKRGKSKTVYYRRSAHGFVINMFTDDDNVEMRIEREERTKNWVENFGKNFNIELSKIEIKRMSELIQDIDKYETDFYKVIDKNLSSEDLCEGVHHSITFMMNLMILNNPDSHGVMKEMGDIILNKLKTIEE